MHRNNVHNVIVLNFNDYKSTNYKFSLLNLSTSANSELSTKHIGDFCKIECNALLKFKLHTLVFSNILKTKWVILSSSLILSSVLSPCGLIILSILSLLFPLLIESPFQALSYYFIWLTIFLLLKASKSGSC